MMLTAKFRSCAAPIYSITAFMIAALFTFLLNGLVLTNVKYSPALPDLSAMAGGELAIFFAEAAKGTVVQLVAVFVSGFSVTLLPVCICVFAFRGVAFGFALSALTRGILSFTTESFKLCEGLYIPSGVALLLVYIASTVTIAFFSLIASSFFRDVVCRQTPELGFFGKTIRYLYILLVFTGALTLGCILRIMIL